MYHLIIKLESEKAALYLKEQIEEHFPLVAGGVRIQEIPPITTLDEMIKQQNAYNELIKQQNAHSRVIKKRTSDNGVLKKRRNTRKSIK